MPKNKINKSDPLVVVRVNENFKMTKGKLYSIDEFGYRYEVEPCDVMFDGERVQAYKNRLDTFEPIAKKIFDRLLSLGYEDLEWTDVESLLKEIKIQSKEEQALEKRKRRIY